MKKVIVILIALIICLSMCACSNQKTNIMEENNIKEDVVGIWYLEMGSIIYIYKDGTCDYYGRTSPGGPFQHYNPFTWEVEGEYIVLKKDLAGTASVSKYTLDGNTLLDKQGKLYATKHSSDTSVDINLD